MSEKKISYLNRTFDNYRDALKDFSRKYYPDLATNYNDASVGSWLIDLNADVADNLSYHIDRVYQETNIDSAREGNSIYNIARNNGVKIPGPKGAMAEVRFTCQIPVDGDTYDKRYLPVIKRGTMVNSSSQVFEVMYDVDFSEQYDDFLRSDRTIEPVLNSNGSWGVDDIQHNTMLVILLVINALAFNIADFFTGDGLKDLQTSLSGLMPSNTPT